MIPYILAAIGGYLIGDSMKGKQYANGGELESDRKKALEWWSSLSINEQKEYSRKHLSPYYYNLIWDYSLSKHISYKKYYDLRVEIWKKETQMAGGGKVGKMLYKEGDIVYVFQSASDKNGKLRKDVDSKYVVGNEYAKNLQKWAKVEIVGIISDELGWERYRGKKIEGDYDLYDDKKAKDGEIISFMQSSSSRYNDKPIDWWWNNPKIRTTGSSLNF